MNWGHSEWIATAEAAALTGYTPDHLRKATRQVLLAFFVVLWYPVVYSWSPPQGDKTRLLSGKKREREPSTLPVGRFFLRWYADLNPWPLMGICRFSPFLDGIAAWAIASVQIAPRWGYDTDSA